MIGYRISVKQVNGKTEWIQRGEVSDNGRINLIIPKDAPQGGEIQIEWRLNGHHSDIQS